MMNIEEGGGYHCAYCHNPARQSSNAANAGQGSAQVAVAIHILVAVAAHPFAHDHNIFGFGLCVQFVADITTAAQAAELIDKMRGARDRPLIGVDLRTAYIAGLRMGQLHLFFRAGRVLLFGEMLLAETIMTIRAATQCFLIAFAATASGAERICMSSFLIYILHSGLNSQLFLLPSNMTNEQRNSYPSQVI